MSDMKTFFYIHKPEHNLPNHITYENITNIDNYENNTLSNIIINDLLDFYIYDMEFELLKLIKDKLASGSTIELQAPDINELCIASANLKIDTKTTKSILFGRKSIHTIYDILDMLKHLDLQIVEKKFINIFEYYILAKKNEK